MDIATFNRAKQAYDAQSWDMAVILFSQCGTGPGTGEACHLCGNALMRLGRVQEAVQAYKAAAADATYANRGAVFTNLGKAQMLIGDYYGAVESLRSALQDPTYPGAYKAQIALGDAYSKLGDPRSAGVAYRNAALDGNNPDPAKSLINLGVCFMQLKRPADAAEAYRTALDFSTNDDERNVLNANLGQAYVALNRMIEAVQAFEAAEAGDYQLSPSAKSDYARARAATDSLAMSAGGLSGDSTDMFLKSYGRGVGGIDPLDPLGHSGEIMPSADQSGFFDIDEEAIEAHVKAANKETRKKSHVVRNIVITLLVILVLLIAAAAFLFLRGYGWPTQQATIDQIFSSAVTGQDVPDAWVSSVSAQDRSDALAGVTTGSSYQIEGLDMGAQQSKAVVSVTSADGSVQAYEVDLERSGIGWKVSSIDQVINTVDASTYTGFTADPIGGEQTQTEPDPVETPAEEQYVEGENFEEEGFEGEEYVEE